MTNEQSAEQQIGDSYKGTLDYNNRLLHKTTSEDIRTECVNHSPASKLKGSKKADFEYLIKLGIAEQIALDWLKVRKKPVTETAIKFMTNEGKKCNLSIIQVITLCAERGWNGFRAEYLQNENNYQSHAVKPSVKEVSKHTQGGVLSW